MTIMAGSIDMSRQAGPGTVAGNSCLSSKLQREGKRLGIVWACEASKPTHSGHLFRQGHTSFNKAKPPTQANPLADQAFKHVTYRTFSFNPLQEMP